MPNYFEVEEQSEYMIKLNCVNNIEDVADDFLTEDEVKEMGLNTYGGKQYFTERIEAALVLVKQSIKPGKKSAIIKDELLLEALKNNYRSCGHYLTNTRRVGNRLFYYPQGTKALQTAPSFKNWKQLVTNGQRLMNRTYETRIDFNLSQSDRLKTIELLRKVFTWEDFETFWADANCHYHPDDEATSWIKMMWEDSETIPVVSSN